MLKNNKRNLFLDDIRDPIHAYGYTKYPYFISKEWDIVRNYDEFVKYLNEFGLPELISFDHDLADNQYSIGSFWDDESSMNEKTGYDCAKYLIDYCMDNKLSLPQFYVHSMNPTGKKNITSILDNYLKWDSQEL